MKKRRFLVFFALLGALCASGRGGSGPADRPEKEKSGNGNLPRHYICYRAPGPVVIDGDIEGEEWTEAPWSEGFTDISGDPDKNPRFLTRFKLLWDDRYVYVAAELEEPDLWGTLTERESWLYRDNNFEVFLDPDGDTHNYFEIEVNALGTEWDLLMLRPYRDSRGEGSPAVHGWDLHGMRTAVKPYGTLNVPGDRDGKWTLEMALPVSGLLEAGTRRGIEAGDRWRMNFARTQWRLEAAAGGYRKMPSLPADVWTWSPQGARSLHLPDKWGEVLFSGLVAGRGTEIYRPDPEQGFRDTLRALYYRQQDFKARTGRYAAAPEELGLTPRTDGPELYPGPEGHYTVRLPGRGRNVWLLTQDGRVWKRTEK